MATVTAAICTYRGRPTAGSSLPLGTLVAEYTVALTWRERRHCLVELTLISDGEPVVRGCRLVSSGRQLKEGSPVWRELTKAAADAAKLAELQGAL